MSENQKLCECGCGQKVNPGRRFIKGHNNRRHPISESQLCECGCGEIVKPGNRFINGHQRRKPKPESQLCECGCGELANPGYRFIYGHHARGKNNPMFGTSRSIPTISGEKHWNWQGGLIIKICETCGTEFKITKSRVNTAKFCNKKCIRADEEKLKLLSKVHSMDGNGNWKGGISFDPYCEKFNGAKKKEVRDKYNNCDYLTGIHKDICNVVGGKIQKLSVHHFDYNKMQGCDGHEWKLIPVSRSHNSMFNNNRPFWKRLIEYSLEYDKEYYNN